MLDVAAGRRLTTDESHVGARTYVRYPEYLSLGRWCSGTTPFWTHMDAQ